MSNREQVVEDIISGQLIDTNWQIAIPFEDYGRVSFFEIFIYTHKTDNLVSVFESPEYGLSMSFVANGGFFNGKDIIHFIEKTEKYPFDKTSTTPIKPKWYSYEQPFSLF